jgi:hypothetical protein
MAAINVSVTLADFLTPQHISLFSGNREEFREWATVGGERAGLAGSCGKI